MNQINFDIAFEALTGNPPFPWQQALYERFFADGDPQIPATCNLPTGLGKTSVIAVWLIALANGGRHVPRRLVYVVNRRTVVDQTTDEVVKYRQNLSKAGITWPLAISTLRGQFADNREWSADPSRPAVICGTVDMIGSRLLFSGYGCGFKTRPLQAGFLGQDALLIHDEAHLEPAFQTLIRAIEHEQHKAEGTTNLPWKKLRVMELSATSRGNKEVFTLTDEEKNPQPPNESIPAPLKTVWKRMTSRKGLAFHAVDRSDIAREIGKQALQYKPSCQAILIFVRTVEEVKTVQAILTDKKEGVQTDQVQVLTGTLRGLERDNLAINDPIFLRFLLKSKTDDRTNYLICTSAGEVGIDLSADHLVCDLTPYDSMAQRLGRVNRRGDGEAKIDVFYERDPDPKKSVNDLEQARWKTKEFLERLPNCDWIEGRHEASPHALGRLMESLTEEERKAAFTPEPTRLLTSDILFDAWALTTIRDKLPGRPPVEPYLHGVEEKEQYDTTFAWREEVALLVGVKKDKIAELLDEFPLKPHETLRIPTFGKRSAFDHLEAIAERDATRPVWVIDSNDDLDIYPSLKELLKKNGKEYAVSLASRTVVLSPLAGGLTKTGTLDGGVSHSEDIDYDVAGTPSAKVEPLYRLKLIRRDGEEVYQPVAPTEGWQPDAKFDDIPKQFRRALWIDLDRETEDDEPAVGVIGYVVLRQLKVQTAKAEPEWPALERHNHGVRGYADVICKALNLDPHLAEAVLLAAAYHDLGKGRAVWQRGAENVPANGPVAKTLHGRAPENLNRYRHELGSMVDAVSHPEYFTAFDNLEHDDQRELLLHLIATHHGRGRPHFPEEESHDGDRPDTLVAAVVGEVPGRFARLQHKYGRWGLAYVESLLRAADALESRRIDSAPLAAAVSGVWPTRPSNLRKYAVRPNPKPSITVAVDPTNPGQFFACCGLLELANRLWNGAEGWFEGGEFCIACEGTLKELLTAAQSVKFSEEDVKDSEEDEENDDEGDDGVVEPLEIISPIQIRLDWWSNKSLKTWAGSMKVRSIAAAMLHAIDPLNIDPLNQEQIVYNPPAPIPAGKKKSPKAKKREPFCFDSRRGPNARSRDVGFSPDKLEMKTLACPVVEFLCLIGLQRCRPTPTTKPRIFTYWTWTWRCCVSLLPIAVNGLTRDAAATCFRFENGFRSGQRKHKAYFPATPISSRGDQ